MTTINESLKALVLDVIGTNDYDASKYFDLEISEDPECAEEDLKQLVEIARKHVIEIVSTMTALQPRKDIQRYFGIDVEIKQVKTRKPDFTKKKASKKK